MGRLQNLKLSLMRFSATIAFVAALGFVFCAAADLPDQYQVDGPVAWWTFDDSEGDERRNRVMGPDGKAVDVLTQNGVSGGAVKFSGKPGARVEVKLDALQDRGIEQVFNGPFTLELWLLDEAEKPDNRINYSVFYKADAKAFTRNSLWLYRARGDGNYHFRIRSGRDEGVLLSIPNPGGAKTVGDGRWHHLVICVRLDEGKRTAVAYVDGREVVRAEGSGESRLFDNDGPLIVGNNHHRNSPWAGAIDELAIYDRPLSPAAVVRHYEVGRRAFAPPPPTEPMISREDRFELHVRPLLVEKCAGCHSGKPDTKSRLYVLSKAALLRGGDYGPAIVPGDAEGSLLIEAALRIHKELKMPPKEAEKLSQREVDHLIAWVNEGAWWPEGDGLRPVEVASNEEGSIETDHWAFQPRSKPAPPKDIPGAWAGTAIDRFLAVEHREQRLEPAGLADRRTLIRRATFDLIGLPPRGEEVEAFLSDPADDHAAFARLVDRLLASRHYGERWGRHWLDVARYADTQGDVGDYPIPYAYKYRNWVIDALNRDMPYDEFLQRQVAGDLMADVETDERAARDSIVATGFIALSRRVGNTKTEDVHLMIEDTMDTLGRGVLGLTFRCARCHDHKFDPLVTSDYYGIYGVFAGTRYPWMGASDAKSPSDLSPGMVGEAHRKKADEYFRLITRYEYQMNNHFRPWLKPTLEAYRGVMGRMKAAESKGENVEELEKEREKHLKFRGGKFRELMIHGLDWIKKEKTRLATNPDYDWVFAVSDRKPVDVRVHLRGNPKVFGQTVSRRAPLVMGGDSFASEQTSGRLELAQWLTREDHPLTARVLVNRVWAKHFGRGLVPTLDNFGRQGGTPSHPELLDWLANQFVADGWSLKKLHRRIMLSRAFRLRAGEAESVNFTRDPDNVWLWHFPRRRLEAEAIRDSMLAVSGELDPEPGGAHPFRPWHARRYSLNGPFNEEFSTRKRSVYLMTQRLFKHPFLGLFDGPDTASSTAERRTSNNPGQALYLMNSKFVREQAMKFAERALETKGSSGKRIQWIWRRAYSRDAEPGEVELALAHIGRHMEKSDGGERASVDAWASLCRAILTSNEFLYVD